MSQSPETRPVRFRGDLRTEGLRRLVQAMLKFNKQTRAMERRENK